MSRTTTTVLIVALASAAFAADEPHLRSEVAKEVIAVNQGNDDDEKNRHGAAAGTFSVEKGIKCEGNWNKENVFIKKCQGGMKTEFAMEFSAEDMAKELAGQLFQETNSFMPGVEAYYPDEEAIAALMEFDDESLFESMAEGHSKTVEFGGVIKAEFGCKVTFGHENGKFSKKSECGFKGRSGAGKKPEDADEEIYTFEDNAEF
jgi:hypothetical protein